MVKCPTWWWKVEILYIVNSHTWWWNVPRDGEMSHVMVKCPMWWWNVPHDGEMITAWVSFNIAAVKIGGWRWGFYCVFSLYACQKQLRLMEMLLNKEADRTFWLVTIDGLNTDWNLEYLFFPISAGSFFWFKFCVRHCVVKLAYIVLHCLFMHECPCILASFKYSCQKQVFSPWIAVLCGIYRSWKGR